MNEGKRGSQNSNRLVLSGGIMQKINRGLAVDPPQGIGGEEVLALGQVLGHGLHHMAKRRVRRLTWFWKKEQQPADGFIHHVLIEPTPRRCLINRKSGRIVIMPASVRMDGSA